MGSGVLNVCSPYTARDETTTAIRHTVQEVYDGSLPLRYVSSQFPPHLFPIIGVISRTVVADEKEPDTHAYIQQPRNMPEYPICHPYEGTGEGMWKDRYLREDI